MAAGSNIAFKIAAKRLQIETWLLLTVYCHRRIQRCYRGPIRCTV